MEHIKQQIEALREQADKLAQELGGSKAEIIMTMVNANGSKNFTEQEAEKIDILMAESGCFRKSSYGQVFDGAKPHYYYLNGVLSGSFVVSIYVKESRDTEIDRLRRRLAELEGGER